MEHQHNQHVHHDKNDKHDKHDNHSGHDEHAGHHTADFLKRFWLCLVLTIPVLLLSHMIQEWLGIQLRFTGDQYVLLALSTFIYIYGGMPFLKGLVS